MALFTDGTLTTVEELTAHDSSILDVASTEGIDLTKKLDLAQQEIGVELAAMLERLRAADAQYGATLQDVNRVAATPALRLWHVFASLELAYRDAYHSQLNDRYKQRRDEYRLLAKWAQEKLMQTGIGLIDDPVAQAAQPTIATVGGALTAGLYFVTMCWTNQRGEEGMAAEAQGIAAASGTGFRTTPGAPPSNATGWNVYVGRSAETMRRQNTTPLATGAQWTQNSSPTTSGPLPGTGQATSRLLPRPRLIQRG